MQPDALVAAEYTRMALVYEERAAPRFAPIARRTVDLAALRPGERVLDVGCGTGLATLMAAEAVGPSGEVAGVDLSEGQLGVAAGRAALRGLANVRWQMAHAARLPFEAAFDAAISNLGIPADTEPVLAAMRRALRPGGRLSIAEWEDGRTPSFDAFHAIVQARRVAEPGPELRAAREAMARRRGDRKRWGSVEGFRAALERAGFRGVEVRPTAYDVRFEGWRALYDFEVAWGWTEAEVRALPGPEREALHRDLAARFGEGPFVDRWALLHATASA